MPINNSRIPPPVRSAASEMPSPLSIASPKIANSSKMPVAMAVPLTAMVNRSRGADEAVSAAYMAATSIGPTVAKNVANATAAVSIIIYCCM
jgi:hypothetical protein